VKKEHCLSSFSLSPLIWPKREADLSRLMRLKPEPCRSYQLAARAVVNGKHVYASRVCGNRSDGAANHIRDLLSALWLETEIPCRVCVTVDFEKRVRVAGHEFTQQDGFCYQPDRIHFSPGDRSAEAIDAGQPALDAAVLDDLVTRYRAPATAGLAASLYRRTATAKDARRLARRFLRFEDMILRFATRPDLDIFSNNEAERTIRPAKVQQRSSGGCWRTLTGHAWLPPGLEPASQIASDR
jgi:hypothetical protein